MINPVNAQRSTDSCAHTESVVSLAERVRHAGQQTVAAEPDDSAIESMVRRMAVQQFMEDLLLGEPELTGVTPFTLNDDE